MDAWDKYIVLPRTGPPYPVHFQKEQTMYELGLILLGVAIGATLEAKGPLGLRWIFSQFCEEIEKRDLCLRERRALKE
jgi:hypothetical protein